jgi:hypothetical protein
MSKLWSLKRWLPLAQAAQHIATLTDDLEVNVADILQLALEGEIKLSVVFTNGVLARFCTTVDPTTVKFSDVPSIDGQRTIRIFDGGTIFHAPQGDVFQANGEVGWLEVGEPYDLVMLGGERADVQRHFWRLSGSTMEDTTNFHGTFVEHRLGHVYYQLMDKLTDTYYPLGNLPENAAFVIRQSEIRRFVDSLAEPQDSTSPTRASHWPWGSHHTELLGQLEAAAQRFWVNFDPADNTTAPTNEVVAAWLVERGVSRRTADTMASILRADGLPTGPRTSH